jgi:hypothetical protein
MRTASCAVLNFKSEFAEEAKEKMKMARRTLLRAKHAAEDSFDTATIAIKKNPMKAVCVTFGTAFLLGGMAGWLSRRNY